MIPRKFLLTLKTDSERCMHLSDVAVFDWDIVAQWEEETTDPEMKRMFHSYAVSLYHREEYMCTGDV